MLTDSTLHKPSEVLNMNMLNTEPGTVPEEQRAGASALGGVHQPDQAFTAGTQWKPPEDGGREHVRPYAW